MNGVPDRECCSRPSHQQDFLDTGDSWAADSQGQGVCLLTSTKSRINWCIYYAGALVNQTLWHTGIHGAFQNIHRSREPGCDKSGVNDTYIDKHIIFLNFEKCRDDSLVKKSMGTRARMEHVQERPHVQLSTSHTRHKYPYMWCIHYKQVSLTAMHLEFLYYQPH